MKLYKDKYIYYIIISAFFLYIPLIIFRDFTPTNELKYINIVDHMIKSNDWIQFRFDGVLYTDKPPLYFWILALIRIITGKYTLFLIGLVVCVIPALIIGLDIYKFLINNNYNKKRAFTVILILYTIMYFIGSVAVIRMDILMTMFIVKAVISFYNIVEKDKEKIFLPYVYMGVGFLIKGLAAVFIPLSIVIMYLFITKQRGKIKKICLLKGLIIVTVLAFLWLIPLVLSLGINITIKELIFKQTINRAVNTNTHKKPVYYYLVNLIPNLFPWMFFFFTSIILMISKIKKENKFLLYILCWFTAPFIIFSLVSSKLDIYLIPVYGGIAVIIEYLFSSDCKKLKKVTGVITSCMFLLFIIVAFIAKKELVLMNHWLFKLVLVYGIFSLLTFVLGVYFSLKEKNNKFIYNIVFNIFFLTVILSFATPFINEYIGFTKFIEIIKKEKSQNTNFTIIGFKENEVNRMTYALEDKNIKNIENSNDITDLIKKENLIIFVRNKNIDELPEEYQEIYKNNKFSIIKYIREE